MMRRQRHAGFDGLDQARSATDWGLDWNVALEQGGWLVGKEIKLEIAVAADEVAAGRDAPSWSAPPPDPGPSATRRRPDRHRSALLRASGRPRHPDGGVMLSGCSTT